MGTNQQVVTERRDRSRRSDDRQPTRKHIIIITLCVRRDENFKPIVGEFSTYVLSALPDCAKKTSTAENLMHYTLLDLQHM